MHLINRNLDRPQFSFRFKLKMGNKNDVWLVIYVQSTLDAAN